MNAEKIRILEALDVAAARQHMPDASSEEVVLLALHKARYLCGHVRAELRHQSGAWLRERGYGMYMGEPLLPPGELPS